MRFVSLVFVCSLSIAAAQCGSVEPSPTGPTPAPDPSPSPAPPPGQGSFSVTVGPNPAPWSNQVSTCTSLPNGWKYEQVLTNTGGTTVTISDRTDYMNGARVSAKSGLAIVLEPGEENVVTTQWCSANGTEQSARTDWVGSDSGNQRISVTGATVKLVARP